MKEDLLAKQNKILEEIADKVVELKRAISESRRQGNNPFIADSLLSSVNSKIEWTKHNRTKEDFEKLESLLEEVEYELELENKTPELNVKKEIEDMKDLLLKDDPLPPPIVEKPVFEDGKMIDIKTGEMTTEAKLKEEQENKETPVKAKVQPEEKSDEELEKLKKEVDEVFKEPELTPRNDVVVKKNSESFFLRDGSPISSLMGLAEIIPRIPEEEFNFFMRNEENDFYKWIQFVFNEEELAQKIKGIKTKKDLIDVLNAWKRGE